MIRSTAFGLVDEGPSRARPHTEALLAPRHLPIESTPSRAQRDRERKRTLEARARERRRAKARSLKA